MAVVDFLVLERAPMCAAMPCQLLFVARDASRYQDPWEWQVNPTLVTKKTWVAVLNSRHC